jgi:ABC-2 type transport system permease protein
MNLRRTLVMARKELLHIVRDPQSLAIVIAMPVILVLLFGYGVNIDLKGLPVVVLDQEGSQQSQDLLKHLQASSYFHVSASVNQYGALTRALDRGDAKAGVVIPWDFSQRLHEGGPVQVQVLVDATDDNSANILTGYLQSVIQSYSAQLQGEWLQNHGVAAPEAAVVVQTRTWYNEDLESSAFIIPGILALVMSVIGAFLTSLTIAREWERGTMEQLISTPVSAGEIMFGKLLPYFVLGMMDTILCALLAIFWFKVPFRGSFLTLMIASAMFMIVVLSMGFFISVLAKGQFAASQIALITTFLPAFLLSGFLFAIEQMPVPLQVVTHIIPARYYVTVLKKIFLKGAPAALLYADLIPLAIFTLVLGVLATRSFHKRLS